MKTSVDFETYWQQMGGIASRVGDLKSVAEHSWNAALTFAEIAKGPSAALIVVCPWCSEGVHADRYYLCETHAAEVKALHAKSEGIK